MTLRPASGRPAGALLSPADSRALARPLVHWTAPELAAVARALGDALVRAGRRWSSGTRTDAQLEMLAGPHARAWSADDAPAALRDGEWTPLLAGRSSPAWWSASRPPRDTLLAALFGEGAGGSAPAGAQEIAEALAVECWQEQLAALRALVAEVSTADEATPADDATSPWRRWQGTVVAELPWFGAALSLRVDAALARALVRAAGVRRAEPSRSPVPAPVPVLRALAGTGMRLEARCSGSGIDLGNLVSLRMGDVLRLDHRLDEPMQLVTPGAPDGAPAVCRGWLGRVDTRLCIELARGPASSSSNR